MESSLCEHLSSIEPKRLENSNILKDTCVTCFDTQDSFEGIKICLDCLTVHCAGDLDHYSRHIEATGHNTFFQVKRHLLEENEETNKKPVIQLRDNRLEIESDINRERNYDYEFKLGCSTCKCTLKECTENNYYTDLINIFKKKPGEVEESRKYFIVGNELAECVHTMKPPEKQSTLKTVSQPFSCRECKLNSNLWLCLDCGNIGCGRKQYGAENGNGHALLHYERENHPLIVKLGTISEISADVYCYVCDDAKIDMQINKRLMLFGIDVKNLNKTEKSLSELNLEKNKNFEIGSTDSNMQGELLTPEERLIGINNFGNTCYMSSVLQLLLKIDTFVDNFSNCSVEHSVKCEKDRLNCLFCQLKRIVHGNISGRYVDEKNLTNGLSPLYFLILCTKRHPEFEFNKQQDALEFLTMLLFDLEKIPETNVSNFLSSIKHEITLKKTCSSCKKVVLVPQKDTLMKMFIATRSPSEITSNEILKEEQNKTVEFNDCLRYSFAPYRCELTCANENKRVESECSQSLSQLPKYLLISFNRYLSNSKGEIYKHNAKIKVPDTIDLSECVFEPVPVENLMQEAEEIEQAPKEVMEPLLEMGFSEQMITNAYIKCKRSTEINELVMHILSGEEQPTKKKPREEKRTIPTERPKGSTLYDLRAFISHTGSQINSGHYIAHIYSQKKNSWVTANDTRLLKLDPREKESERGYIYLFEQRSSNERV